MDVSKYVITSEQLLVKYAPLIGDKQDHIWGEYIRRGAVTAIIGETSAGKTTLLHNLVYKLSQGEDFLNIPPPAPLKVFYCDYESYNAVLAEHLMSIGVADHWHFLNKEASDVVPRGVMLTSVVTQLLTTTTYDLIVVDPLMEADPVDENDNTQASMQVSRWRDIAHRFNVGVVLVHNTGTADSRMDAKEKAATAMYRASRKHFGRGASSRADRYDIQLNYVVADDTTRILRVAKTRGRNMGNHWVLKFAEGDLGFVISDFSFNSSHVPPPIESGTLGQLRDVISAHPDESLSAIFKQYVKEPLGMSRSAFFRHAACIRQEAPSISGAPSSNNIEPCPSSTLTASQPLSDLVLQAQTGVQHPHGGRPAPTPAQAGGAGRWHAPHHVQGSYGVYLDTSVSFQGDGAVSCLD